MARHNEDILDLEKEIRLYRDTLSIVKMEIHRIRMEYIEGAKSLGESAISEIDEELENVSLAVENALF